MPVLYDLAYFNLNINKQKLWRINNGTYVACYTYIYSFERREDGTGLYIYPDLKIVSADIASDLEYTIKPYGEVITKPESDSGLAVAITINNNCVYITAQGNEDTYNIGGLIPSAVMGMRITAKTIVDDNTTYTYTIPTAQQFSANPRNALNTLSKPNFIKN